MKNWMKLLLLVVAGILFLVVYFGFLWAATAYMFNTMIKIQTEWFLPICGIIVILIAVVVLTRKN